MLTRRLRLRCRCSYNQSSGVPGVDLDNPPASRRIRPHHPDRREIELRSWTGHHVASKALSPLLDTSTDRLFAEAVTLVGSPEAIKQHATKFFASVQTWLPVVSRLRFFDKLQHHEGDCFQKTAHTLLACTMLLIIHVPDQALDNVARDPLYLKVKRLILLSELECKASLDLVQARLLLASFEFGHGIKPAAYVSIGSCARLAIMLGLDGGQLSDEVLHSACMEERRRTWWGIVILERYAYIESFTGLADRFDAQIHQPRISPPSTDHA